LIHAFLSRHTQKPNLEQIPLYRRTASTGMHENLIARPSRHLPRPAYRRATTRVVCKAIPLTRAKSPAISTASARIHEVEDDLLAAIDYCYEQGWTGGLPVVPPDRQRVEQMLLFEGLPAKR
jgi:hypothetical protein